MIRRGPRLAAACLAVLALTTACGDGGGGSTEVETIDVDVQGDTVTVGGEPAGERIEVDRGQPVDIVVTSDEAGELHVHSSPETTADFEPGTNDPVKLQFDRAGVVEIELHEPFEGPVVSLEVK
ncbi:hypothetical protein [Nocardioides litoris]|uniref:hypothetical protein n=1 Tax=Nocardioides litoris TaxID=1926648 RepID=UPI001122D51C|nr:hypothetical protein [Nocardioides litoris]